MHVLVGPDARVFVSARSCSPCSATRRRDVSLSDPVAGATMDGRASSADAARAGRVPPIEDEMIHQADLDELGRRAARSRRQESARSSASGSVSKTTSRARCRRSATGCTCRASASGRSSRAPRTSFVAPPSFAAISTDRTDPTHEWPARSVDDTGWKPVDDASGVRRASCAATAGASRSGSSGSPTRTSRSAISTARSATSRAYNESLETGRRAGAPRRRRVSRSAHAGTVARRTARRRQDAPRGRGAEAGHSDVRRARPVLRHARSAARHPQHLRPVDSHDRARDPAAGDDAPTCSCSTISARRRPPNGSKRR